MVAVRYEDSASVALDNLIPELHNEDGTHLVGWSDR